MQGYRFGKAKKKSNKTKGDNMNRQLFRDFQRSNSLADVTGPLTDKIKDLVDEMVIKKMDLSSKTMYGIYSIFADYDDNIKSGRYNALSEKEFAMLEMTMHVMCKKLHELNQIEDFKMRAECMLENLKNYITSNLDKIKPGKEVMFNKELMPWIVSKNDKIPSGVIVGRIMSVLITEGVFMTEDLLTNIKILSVAGIRSIEYIKAIYLEKMKKGVHIKTDDFVSAMTIAFQFHIVYDAFDEKNRKSKDIPESLKDVHRVFNEVLTSLKSTVPEYDFMVQYFKEYMQKDMTDHIDKSKKNKFNQDDFE